MSTEESQRHVHVNLVLPSGRQVKVGELRTMSRTGYQRASLMFEYDVAFLTDAEQYPLSPDLPAVRGPQYVPGWTRMFGALADAMPDQWGRHLIQSESRRQAGHKGQVWSPLDEMGLLLSVDDVSRQGAVRLSNPHTGEFLAQPTTTPRGVVALPHLLEAAQRYEAGEETDQDILALLEVGTSAGGARPKVGVTTPTGRLAIAKLPSIRDRGDVGAWEATCLTMAKRSGIDTPPFTLHRLGEGRSALVIERFDRTEDGTRLGYLSAATLTQKRPSDALDYVTLAQLLAERSAKPRRDLPELFRRIVFTLLVNNVDDHMKNHGVIRHADGWRLSPMFDVNPAIFTGIVDSTPLTPTGDPSDRDIRGLIAECENFDLTTKQARHIVTEVLVGTADWATVATELGVSAEAAAVAAGAFENVNTRRARALTSEQQAAPTPRTRRAPHDPLSGDDAPPRQSL